MTPLYAGFSLSDECPEMAESGLSESNIFVGLNVRFQK